MTEVIQYPSVSFTGSEGVGRSVGKVVQSRFGKVILELGGNNGKFFSKYNYPLLRASYQHQLS